MSEFKRTSVNHETATSAQIPDSAYFQMLEHAKNFGTLPRVQAPSGTPWTKEDAINQLKELGARLEPPTAEVYIMDVLQRLGRDFEPKINLLRVKDLLAEGRSYAASVLNRIAKADKSRFIPTSATTVNYLWSDHTQYAPKELRFLMDEESILPFDQNGRILSPLILRRYEKALDQLDPSLVAAGHSFYGVTGYFTEPCIEGGCARFYPAQTVEASDILLAIAWGGSNSKRCGLSEDKAAQLIEDGQIKFFEKVTSKQGHEGRDYLVISLEDDRLRAAVAFDEGKAAVSQADKVMEFADKLQIIDRARQYQADFMEEYDNIWTELEGLKERVMSNPILNETFVIAPPDLSVPNSGKIDASRLSPQMSLEELTYALPSWEDHKDLLSKIAQMQIEVEAWEEFAPRFNELQAPARKLHGRLEIFGTYAELHLGCLTIKERDINTADHPKKTFDFTEADLLKCAQKIAEHLEKEANNKEASTQLIGELLGNEKPIDNDTNSEEAPQAVAVDPGNDIASDSNS